MGEIDGVMERKWNMKRLLCYMSMILQISLDINVTTNVRRRIKQRLADWDEV